MHATNPRVLLLQFLAGEHNRTILSDSSWPSTAPQAVVFVSGDSPLSGAVVLLTHDPSLMASPLLHRIRRLFFDKDGLPRGTITPADPAHDSAVEAQRDLNQVAFIFDVIPETELANQVEKLQLVLNDPVLPQDAERASTGRDTQSELFAAAICWNAGLLPVTLDEPDVRCICSGVILALP